ncbi:YggS family pyridoxal phosphate-dependent enzyme [Parvularcula sp. LCG005]|uniref:YggS family pyridoxal phosphate-dependent enzyme n=1 Tax=Parvularcula sp. LCG005 TaxID=3078805 RepID=UPI002942C8F6|nr:YggS family pyridoxal phosphate-dependent enzyme [Parvularcula sp. LCG005]WOI53219.1 YggS family pyridoxal phosphate-dependent enzyme [Parvularcula sp. LCG005]
MTDLDVIENYRDVMARVAKAAADAERDAGDIALTVVSKTHGAEIIEPLLQLGHRRFGENRVQEAQEKWPSLKERYEGTRLHLIGSLQSKKSEDAVALFDVIEVLDREKLAHTLAAAMEKLGRRPSLYVQVNTGEEEQKGGVMPYEAVAFTQWARDDLGLPVIGLMCIPPADEPPAPHFALLYELAEKAGVDHLSMGMSGDYETAIHLGATSVRVGSSIFGARG